MIQGLSSINSVFRKVTENLTIGKSDIGIFCERAQLERFQVVRSLGLRLGLDRLSLSSLILFSGEIEGPGAIFIKRMDRQRATIGCLRLYWPYAVLRPSSESLHGSPRGQAYHKKEEKKENEFERAIAPNRSNGGSYY